MICLLNAAQEAGIPFQAVSLKVVGNADDLFGLSRSTLIEDGAKPDFGETATSLFTGSDEPVYSFIGGVRHVRLGLRRLDDPSEPAFDFVLPDAPRLPLEGGVDVIPADAVREVIRRSFAKRLKILGKVTRLAPGRVVQFAPPPPVSDRWLQPFLLKHNAKSATLPNRMLRWKLWRLTVDVIRLHAEGLGARFLDCPPEAVDADGFMRDELVRNVTHGNLAFGMLLLNQIRGPR